VNLSFRGFKEADAAVRDGAEAEAKEYEAHLGLALALRGAIDDSNSTRTSPTLKRNSTSARSSTPIFRRPITTRHPHAEYRAKGSQEAAVRCSRSAADIYRTFIARANAISSRPP